MDIILLILAMIIPIVASLNVKASFSKWSQVENSRGMTGAEAAQYLLQSHGVNGVQIEGISGSLTDHFDPTSNTIRLSETIMNKRSIAAVGVAMHEAGHALQYAEQYTPLVVRNAVVKSTNICSYVSYFLVLLGILFSSSALLTFGIFFFCAVIFFQLITLPVEFNASHRALTALQESGMFAQEELTGVRKMLTAAALTYVAAVAVSLLQLLRLLMIRDRRR